MPLGKINYIWEVSKGQVGRIEKKPFRLCLVGERKENKHKQTDKQLLLCDFFKVRWYGRVLEILFFYKYKPYLPFQETVLQYTPFKDLL